MRLIAKSLPAALVASNIDDSNYPSGINPI
jgi:hypothetical protein